MQRMSKRQRQELIELQRRLGFEFRDQDILQEAMSHSSLENKRNNERLEFLGDGVLNLVIAEHVISLFPKAREGQLSRIRAQLVCKDALAKVGTSLHLADALILGPSEARGGSQQRKSIIADAVEAIIGAVFQSAGYLEARVCILRWFSSLLNDISLDLAVKDPKTQLQEYCQQRKFPLPTYELVDEKQASGDTYFSVRVCVEKLNLSAAGDASSRKKAEQIAASLLMAKICE